MDPQFIIFFNYFPLELYDIIYFYLKAEDINVLIGDTYLKMKFDKAFWKKYFLAIYNNNININKTNASLPLNLLLNSINLDNLLRKVAFDTNEYNSDLIYPLIYLGANINIFDNNRRRMKGRIGDRTRILLDCAKFNSDHQLIKFLKNNWKFLRTDNEKCMIRYYDNDKYYRHYLSGRNKDWFESWKILIRHGDILTNKSGDTYVYNALTDSLYNMLVYQVIPKIITKYIKSPLKFYAEIGADRNLRLKSIKLDLTIHPSPQKFVKIERK